MATTAGVGSSGLDVNSIVSQLMAVERRPIAKLDRKEAGYQAKLSAFGSVKGVVAGFQTAVQGLNSASKFQSLKATASDATIFSASASSTAVAGAYSLEVTSLAQAQKLVAAGQTSSTAAIGASVTTTVTFDFGAISGGTYTAYVPATGTGGTYAGSTFTSNGSGTKTVTIDGTNNSLQGIRDAINAAGIGVTAAIVNDGSSTPYRLTLASNNMGVSNSLNISVSGDATIGNLLTNNPGTVAAVAGSNTVATGTKVAAAAAGTTAGTLAAGTLIANTSAGAISIGAVTLGTNAAANGAAIALAINTALAAATGGATVNGTAAADGAGIITITAGSSAITLSMGGFAATSAAATANQAALVAQTGFNAAQLGTQAIGAQKMAQSVTAQNAVFNVNGVQVSKTSNTVSDVVQGVTLTLSKVTTSPATLTVARDTASISSSISSFVKAYNDLATTLKNASAYDPVAKQGAILQGDSTVRTLQAQLRSMLSTPVVGTSGALTTLSDVGVSFQSDGTLAINQTKLDSVMASNFSDIASLFAATGKATDSLVSFSSATSSTKAGSYAVNVTQLATQGKAVGSAAVGNFTIGGTNDELTLSVDGTSASITLSAGTYTAATLAAELQSKINSVSALSAAGISVAVTQSANVLTITSARYGSTSVVDITGGDGVSNLMGTPTETTGVDVAGSIGGVTATGSGQTLSAASGDPQGLSIIINGGITGARGTLNYSQGYAYLLDKWGASSLASGGILASRTDGIGKTITDIGKQRNAMETRLIGIEKRYREQFTRLDIMLSSMNTTSTYLTQQLAQLSNLK